MANQQKGDFRSRVEAAKQRAGQLSRAQTPPRVTDGGEKGRPEIESEEHTQGHVGEAPRKPPDPKTRDLPPKEVESRAGKKARLAQVLHRGLVNDRLRIRNQNPNRYYMWARTRDIDITRLEGLGFVVEKEAGDGLHATGDSTRRVGDVILVSTDRENFEILQELRREQKAARSTLGKKEYLRMAKMRNPDVPVLDPLKVGEE